MTFELKYKNKTTSLSDPLLTSAIPQLRSFALQIPLLVFHLLLRSHLPTLLYYHIITSNERLVSCYLLFSFRSHQQTRTCSSAPHPLASLQSIIISALYSLAHCWLSHFSQNGSFSTGSRLLPSAFFHLLQSFLFTIPITGTLILVSISPTVRCSTSMRYFCYGLDPPGWKIRALNPVLFSALLHHPRNTSPNPLKFYRLVVKERLNSSCCSSPWAPAVQTGRWSTQTAATWPDGQLLLVLCLSTVAILSLPVETTFQRGSP